MPEPKVLLLVRHAKSSWKDPDLCDVDRPLNKRGRRDAPEMGRRLAARGLSPAVIVSSPAVRARATAESIAEQIGYVADIVVEEDLYGGTSGEVLDIVSLLNDDVRTALIVFHNPTINDLANRISHEPIENVPTCGVLTLQLNEPHWHQVRDGMELIDFDYPRRR